MIELLVLVILIAFFIYLVHAIFSSGLTFFINVCIIWLSAGRASSDLRSGKMTGFYLAAALATVALFIAEDTQLIKPLFDFFSRAYVLPISIALVAIVFFANLFRLCSVYSMQLYKIARKKIAEQFSK